MQFSGSPRLTYALVAGLLCFGAQAQAANFPLEILNIKPAGQLSPNNRIYRAYPGFVYNIRAAVVGGAYPFTYTLTNAPAGMTINEQTGEINWPNPQADATPTITVRDTEGTQVSATWAIDVTTTGFRFVNAGCTSGCGAGTLASPWRTISEMISGNSAGGEIVYFRAGTYRITDMARRSEGTPWERIEISEGSKPVAWLAYPGERPIINYGYQAGGEWGPFLRLEGDNVYVDGFETVNSHIMAFQMVSGYRGGTFRKLRMHDHGPGMDGANASFIMTMTSPTPSEGTVIQDCEFFNSDPIMLKIYAQRKLLIEGNIFRDGTGAIEVKGDSRQFTIRGNSIYNISNLGVGGNMHDTTTHGEITFNYIRTAGPAVDLNQDAMAGVVYVQRNTLVGRAQVRNTDAADGPFHFTRNVIVNDDAGTPSGSHIYHSSVDASRVIQSNNLAGYPNNNIVDANGRLTAGYAQYVGTHGHQVGAGGGPGPGPGPAPAAPTNVRIISN